MTNAVGTSYVGEPVKAAVVAGLAGMCQAGMCQAGCEAGLTAASDGAELASRVAPPPWVNVAEKITTCLCVVEGGEGGMVWLVCVGILGHESTLSIDSYHVYQFTWRMPPFR